MSGQTIILNGPAQHKLAHCLIDIAPKGAVFNIKEASRNEKQNARMWAMLSDVSRAKPEGHTHTADMWKCLFMKACGHEVQFIIGLDGQPFPVGFSTSRLTVRQMADLITFIAVYGDRHGVEWSEPNPYEVDE